MAPTLTEEKRVAWKIQGVGPDPAHTVVVFKRVGLGRILHKVLQPGEVLKLRWSESLDSYLAYAVSRDPDFSHSFTRKFQGVDQTKTFYLHFDIQMSVLDAEVLALKFVAADPLRLLEDEIAKVLGATARHLPWEEIKRESPCFGLQLLESDYTEVTGERRSNLDRLQRSAKNLGFNLRNVSTTRSLTEKHLEVDLANQDVDTQLAIEEAEARLAMGRSYFKHRREVQHAGLEWEREQLAIQRRQTLQGIERLKAVYDNLTKEGLRGFSQAVDGVRSFAAISDAFLEVQSIQSSLLALSSGMPSAPAANPVLPGVQGATLLTEGRRPSDPLERLVSEAFLHLRILDGNPGDKRRIAATLLHLFAEAGLGGEGDEDLLKEYCESLKQQLYPLESALEEEQLVFLRRTTDYEKLRRDLA